MLLKFATAGKGRVIWSRKLVCLNMRVQPVTVLKQRKQISQQWAGECVCLDSCCPSVSLSGSTVETRTEDWMCLCVPYIFHQSNFCDCLSLCVPVYVEQSKSIGKKLLMLFSGHQDWAACLSQIDLASVSHSAPWTSWRRQCKSLKIWIWIAINKLL